MENDWNKITEMTSHFFSLFNIKDDLTPKVERIRNLFIPQGLIIKNTKAAPEIYDLEGFISSRVTLLTNGTFTDFSEHEISGTMDIFENIAHRFSRYEKSGKLNGEPFQTTGVKTFQFIKVDDAWKISSLVWSDQKLNPTRDF